MFICVKKNSVATLGVHIVSAFAIVVVVDTIRFCHFGHSKYFLLYHESLKCLRVLELECIANSIPKKYNVIYKKREENVLQMLCEKLIRMTLSSIKCLSISISKFLTCSTFTY